jgi:hypothetical protein
MTMTATSDLAEIIGDMKRDGKLADLPLVNLLAALDEHRGGTPVRDFLKEVAKALKEAGLGIRDGKIVADGDDDDAERHPPASEFSLSTQPTRSTMTPRDHDNAIYVAERAALTSSRRGQIVAALQGRHPTRSGASFSVDDADTGTRRDRLAAMMTPEQLARWDEIVRRVAQRPSAESQQIDAMLTMMESNLDNAERQ